MPDTPIQVISASGRRPAKASREWPLLKRLAIALVLTLLCSLFLPTLLLWLFGAATLLTCVAASVVGLLLLRKVWRDNTGEAAFLTCWRPTFKEGLRVSFDVFWPWSILAFIGVVLFGAHGLIVGFLQQILVYLIDRLGDNAQGASQEVTHFQRMLTDGPFAWAVPEGVASSLGSIRDFSRNFAQILNNLLTILLWWFVIEGWLSIGLFLWAAVRVQMKVFARRVVALPTSGTKRPSLITFDKGFFT